MTLKGEILGIQKGFRIRCQNAKDCNNEELFKGLETQATLSILSAIKGRVPKENLPPSGSLEDKYSYLAGQRKGFNDCRNQFLNEVEG